LQNLQDVFFLQTNGSGVLSFNSAGGDFVKLLSTSLSGTTSINVDGYFTSDYDRYVCYLSNIHYEGANNGGVIRFRFRRSNADVTASNYASSIVRAYNDGTTTGPYAWTNWNESYGFFTEGSSSLTYSGHVEITFNNPLETNASPSISTRISGWQSSSYLQGAAGTIGLNNSNGAISGFSIFSNGVTNLTIKKLTLYGIKD
jgi:hypothetical protein